MENEGSTAGFILALIAGILWILVGLTVIARFITFIWASGFLGKSPSSSVYLALILGVYLIIIGIFIITSGVWMRKDVSLKKGALTSLILGILSLNLLAIIGGIVGLIKKS